MTRALDHEKAYPLPSLKGREYSVAEIFLTGSTRVATDYLGLFGGVSGGGVVSG